MGKKCDLKRLICGKCRGKTKAFGKRKKSNQNSSKVLITTINNAPAVCYACGRRTTTGRHIGNTLFVCQVCDKT